MPEFKIWHHSVIATPADTPTFCEQQIFRMHPLGFWGQSSKNLNPILAHCAWEDLFSVWEVHNFEIEAFQSILFDKPEDTLVPRSL